MMAIYELIPVDYGIYDAYMICIHDMDFGIWRNIGLVCYGTVLIVYCVTRYNDDKLVWRCYDVGMMVCGVFMYLFGVLRMLECDVWMLDILVKYTCMYCNIVVIRLRCIVCITLYNCNLIIAYTWLELYDCNCIIGIAWLELYVTNL